MRPWQGNPIRVAAAPRDFLADTLAFRKSVRDVLKSGAPLFWNVKVT
jgi:hypothetical protein